MYTQSVVLCDPKKYVKANDSLLSTVFSAELKYYFDGNVYVCKTCDGASSFFMNSIFIYHVREEQIYTLRVSTLVPLV